MTKMEFDQGVMIFSEAFPNFEFNPKLWWPIVQNLDGSCYLHAIHHLAKTQKELYPGSNPLALICEKHDEFVLERRSYQRKRLAKETEAEKMERWKREAVPPPKEWHEMKKKINKKFGVDVKDA